MHGCMLNINDLSHNERAIPGLKSGAQSLSHLDSREQARPILGCAIRSSWTVIEQKSVRDSYPLVRSLDKCLRTEASHYQAKDVLEDVLLIRNARRVMISEASGRRAKDIWQRTWDDKLSNCAADGRKVPTSQRCEFSRWTVKCRYVKNRGE